jgi:hypothetical protein
MKRPQRWIDPEAMLLMQHTYQGIRLCYLPLQVWILSAALVIAGGSIVWFLGRVTVLSCDRFGLRTGTCLVQQIRPVGERSTTLSLRDVHGASIDWESRIVLHTSLQNFVLTNPYSDSGLNRPFIVQQINHFLDNPYTIRLVLQDDGRPFAYILGSILIMAGVVFGVCFGSLIVYEVDLTRRILTLKQQRLWGSEQCECSFDHLHHIDLAQADLTDPRQRCHISLKLCSGDRIPFTPSHGLSRQAARKTVFHLQQCLINEPIEYGTFSI